MRRKHGPFSIKLVGFYGEQGPLQMNVVCVNCNSSCYANHPAQLEYLLIRENCPPFVLNLEPQKDSGSFDYETLLKELEKRKQI